MKPFFHFKQFSIRQHNAAMKITTDSVLLGAWTACSGADSILEVGAGTGVVALMLAQRCRGAVTAIEPDRMTFEELEFNVRNSPWGERISSFRTSFQQFLAQDRGENFPGFDLVVSNPPYFMNDLPPQDEGKAFTRHTVTLTYEDLVGGAEKILAPGGRVSVILPYRYQSYFLSLAAGQRLYCNRMLSVRPRKDKAVSRVLIELGREKKPLENRTLVIHMGAGYSEAYRSLTRDYYLHF